MKGDFSLSMHGHNCLSYLGSAKIRLLAFTNP